MHFLQRHGTGNKAIQVYTADFLISPQGLRQSFQLILLFFQLFPLHFPLFFTDNPALFLTDRRPFPADGRIFPCIFIHVFVYFFACLTKILKERPPENTDEAKVEAQKETVRAIVEKLPYTHLSLEGWNGDDMMERFNSPVWEELYHPCLACGTCTFVCPTCQCYDIKDYDTGHGIQRYRCWDSCMYSDFTMMAHGNNRNSQMQRFRQRFMHKLVYFPANNNGMYSCVGCGRCVEKCPSSLNIVKVIKAFEKQGGAKE